MTARMRESFLRQFIEQNTDGDLDRDSQAGSQVDMQVSTFARELFYWWRLTCRSVQRTLLLVEVNIQVSTENSSTGGG